VDEGQLKILLLERDFEPAKGQLSLIGGFVQDQESLDAAAYRILYHLTGLREIFLEQLHTFGEADRDPGDRVISVAYFALLKIQELDPDHVRDHGAYWCPVSSIPPLIFDHNRMVEVALRRLRIQAKVRPIGLKLLPEEFTLPQIQELFEAIYQRKLDDRNFRKKILQLEILEKLNRKDKRSSKKGAFLYRFNEEKYANYLKNGDRFEMLTIDVL
jgi:8-oxo-dGTP diphosphatase